MTKYGRNTYEYDGNNYRVFKQTPTEKTYYNYDGSGNLRFERRGRTEINYIYDAGGIQGMKVTVPTDDPSTYYASSEFYYVKDSLGNIRVILDKSGNIMVEYNYDAWGNFVAEKVREVCIGSVTVDLVSLNAFTYRGYYYDKESGLYYLINRYYDPVTGRFISPDDVGYLDFESFFGTNRYAYCLDDPVMYSDPNGTDWNWNTFWTGVGLILTAISAIALSVVTFGAGIPLAMSIVAGITLTAGILTGINGIATIIATIIEAGAQFNFVRDGIFNGLGWSDEVYDWYAGITEGIAIVGSLILGVYHTTGQYKAAKYGQKYLGKGYKKVGYTNAGKPRYVSKDGLRQMRFDGPHMHKGKMLGNHLNLDRFKGTKPVAYEHVFYNWFKYWIEWENVMKKENKDLSGRMKIEYLDKHRVQIELDNKSIDFLIEVLSDLKNEPGMHHCNFDSDTGSCNGFMTKDSLDLILNNRDKY